jgi:hypothetical protein
MNFGSQEALTKVADCVIPAKAGIQSVQDVLGSRLRGSDGFSDFFRDHQTSSA